MTADANLLFVEPNGEAAATHSLDSNGWRVIRTASVADAMERAKHDHPSAVIFRGALAEGVTLAKKLRCNARTALLPMVVVADAPDGARDELARWGVTSILAANAADELIADAVRTLAPLPPPLHAPDSELGRADRLGALERAKLIDSPPEEPFDRLAHFTAPQRV